MPQIKLRSSDNEVFDVDIKAAHLLGLISMMVNDSGDEETIPVGQVNSKILKKIIEWATYHKDDPPVNAEDEEVRDRRTDDICQWDQDFLKVDIETLFELIQAANYLDIRRLLDLTCKGVANLIKGKTPEQIRETFKIKCVTAEEEEAIREENRWEEKE